MLKKNIVLRVLSIAIFCVTARAHWASGLSKNEKAAFCNFYSSLEGMLTSLELGENPEGLNFWNKVFACVSRRLRRDFEKKWKFVARKKGLKARLEKLYRACLNNSSSAEGRRKCKMLVDYYSKQKKEELLIALALVRKKSRADGKIYRIKNKVELVPCRK